MNCSFLCLTAGHRIRETRNRRHSRNVVLIFSFIFLFLPLLFFLPSFLFIRFFFFCSLYSDTLIAIFHACLTCFPLIVKVKLKVPYFPTHRTRMSSKNCAPKLPCVGCSSIMYESYMKTARKKRVHQESLHSYNLALQLGFLEVKKYVIKKNILEKFTQEK